VGNASVQTGLSELANAPYPLRFSRASGTVRALLLFLSSSCTCSRHSYRKALDFRIQDGSPDQASFTVSGDAWCTAMPHLCQAKLTLTFLAPVAGSHHGRKQHGPRCDGTRGHLRAPGAPSSCRIGSQSCVTVMYHGSVLDAAVEKQMKLYLPLT